MQTHLYLLLSMITMPQLPALDIKTNFNNSPHVVILGAGASKAAFQRGDAKSRPVPLMCDLIECLDLKPILESHNLFSDVDFESFYNDLVLSGKHADLVDEINARVQKYFSQLHLPHKATIYDYLVLSLREKDIIASFNWDPFLALAWQRNSHCVKLPRIVFLHGNVEIAACIKCQVKDFQGNICKQCGNKLEPAPLLYPIKQKNYTSNLFIRSEWNELRLFLQHAYMLTIFGYAAPKTDVDAKNLLLSEWEKNPIFPLAQIEIIDIKPKKQLIETWEDFFCRDHYGISRLIWNSYLFHHPRRSCEAFAMATLQLSPWRENPFPRTASLRKLQKWARLLWEEENQGKLSDRIFEFS